MIARAYADALRKLLRRFAAVTILGPRRCGKTTFIRRALRDIEPAPVRHELPLLSE